MIFSKKKEEPIDPSNNFWLTKVNEDFEKWYAENQEHLMLGIALGQYRDDMELAFRQGVLTGLSLPKMKY